MGYWGSIFAGITGIKVVLLLVALLAAAIWLLLKEIKEKEELQRLLRKAMEGKPISPREVAAVSGQLEQLRLQGGAEREESPRFGGEHPIYKIVITGGPCGGKSTSLSRIQEELGKKGFRVFSVPEIPTLVVQAGGFILMSKFSVEQRIRFQSLLIRFQIYVEDYFTRLAQMSKSPSIIICDRGTVDPAAYVSRQQFQAIMDLEGWTWTSLRDKRYDGVLHLVTAAIGAEEFYTRSNNNARSEGIEQARALDKKTLDAWTGHPHITVCPNVPGQSFEKKLQHAIRGVYKIVGIELQSNRYEKLIVKQPHFPSGLKVETAQNEEVILKNQDNKWTEDKIKRRGQNGNYTYQRKLRAAPNQQGEFTKELRIPLSALQYVQLKEEHADQQYRVVTIHRSQFIVGSTLFTLDTWTGLYGREETHLLRFANPDKLSLSALVPEWIQIEEDVRQNPQYASRNIARIQK